MFPIGEFSQIARVSKRLLQYYDEIGLLKPELPLVWWRRERCEGYSSQKEGKQG
jgi:MerR family regulatory protein